MGYRGKQAEQARARELRAQSWTLEEIACELGVAKGSVSVWVRDVEFAPRPRSAARRRGPNRLQVAKAEEIERLRREGAERIGRLTERDLWIAGLMLYAGEGAKNDRGNVLLANTDPRMVLFHLTWLRRFFDIDESKLRLRLYLHEGLDLEAANDFWSTLTGIPLTQFSSPYRAVADPSIRRSKHPMGCPGVRYCSTKVLRTILGAIDGLLDCERLPG